MNLKDYRPEDPQFDPDEEVLEDDQNPILPSGYQEEINTLKIDKLSNRVTIISIILPCIIGAILIFAYLDMKERVVDVDQTKNSQVQRISQQMEEKLNALDIKIAKNRFDLDKTLPDITGRQNSLEGKLVKIAGTKADAAKLNTSLKALENKITANAAGNKKSVEEIAGIKNQVLSKIEANQEQLNKTFKETIEEINLFKEEFDARLLELSNYEQQIGELRKDQSLLDKKLKRLELETVSKKELEEKLAETQARLDKLENDVIQTNQKLTTNFTRLQKDVNILLKSAASPEIKPQLNVDSPPSPGDIKQNQLTQ